MKPTFIVLADLTPASRRAAYLAGVLAAPVGGELVLLYLQETPVFTPEMGLITIPEDYYTQEREEAEAALLHMAGQLPAPAHATTCRGGLHEVLSGLIEEWKPQLLVMALTHAPDLLDSLLLDQALPVLRDTGLPLLLVPDGAAQNPTLPRMVAVAADGEAFRLNSASLGLRALLASWPAAYCVVHVATPSAEADSGMARAEASVRRSHLLPAVRCTTYEVQQHPRSAGIVQAALDVQAEMVMLLARPHTLLGSVFGCGVVAHLAHTCPVPMLVLPTETIPEPHLEMPFQTSNWLA